LGMYQARRVSSRQSQATSQQTSYAAAERTGNNLIPRFR
jgi:hypothetical protein